MYFFSLISQKPGELFYRNFQFWPVFHWKSAIFSFAMIMTSLWCHTKDVGTYFGMYGKRRPLAILWHQLHVSGDVIFKFAGGGNHPLVKCVTKKRLGRTRVKFSLNCYLLSLKMFRPYQLPRNLFKKVNFPFSKIKCLVKTSYLMDGRFFQAYCTTLSRHDINDCGMGWFQVDFFRKGHMSRPWNWYSKELCQIAIEICLKKMCYSNRSWF